MAVASAGVAITVPNLAALTGIAALAAGSQIDARLVEEPHLRATHGATYDAYATAVPRFLPRLCGGGGRPGARGGSGSDDQQHHHWSGRTAGEAGQ